MRNFLTMIFMMPLLWMLTSCTYTTGEGPIVEKGFAVDPFQAVELEGSFNVNIQQGATQNVVVAAQENIIDMLKMDVMDGVLYLSLEPGNYLNYDLEVKLTMPTIEGISLSGSGDIMIGTFVGLSDLHVELDGSGDIETDGDAVLEITGKTEIELDGSGDIDLKMKASDVNAELDGSGDIDLVGTATWLRASLDGSGDIKAYKLEALNCEAILEGSGDIKVFASKNLEATLEGSGNIRYRGEPSVEAKIDGSGSIEAD